MNIGEKLKEIRINRGYSQVEVAESIGISRYLISKYENNICIPRGKILISLANLYKINIDYLLDTNKNSNLIDYYGDILDATSKSKINPFMLDKNNEYFAILSNFENHFGINKGDMLIFARNCCEFHEKIVLVSYLSTEVLLGFLWAKNGVKMLQVKDNKSPIDISDDKKYTIMGYLVKSIREYDNTND